MHDIEGPLDAVAGLEELGSLFEQLHRHHLEVATFGPLVHDPEEAWTLRRRWYEQILAAGGRYFVARDQAGLAIGYGLVELALGRDDTFDVRSGIAEVVSLVVDEAARGNGVGQALMAAIEAFANAVGADLLKVAVMAGNRSAYSFYATNGFLPGEHVLYRPCGDGPRRGPRRGQRRGPRRGPRRGQIL